MPLDRASLASDMRRLREDAARRSSPFNDSVLGALEERLAAGEPRWWRALESAWEGRTFTVSYERPALLLGALHLQALAGGSEALARAYPSCGGSGADGPDAALRYLDDAPPAFWELLSRARLQTNEVRRSIGWLLTACMGFLTRGTAFHLVEGGSSAGLTLAGDCLPREHRLIREDGAEAAPPDRFSDSPYPVLSRLGLDADPRDLGRREERLWLKANLPPDDPEAHARFDRAADLFLALRREKAGPRLERCAFADMPRRIAGIPAHPDEGLLVYNSQAADFLPKEGYAELRAGLERALKPWEDRGFWAELELPRDRAYPFHELRVSRVVDGLLQTRTLARLTGRPREVQVLPGWDFLRPLKPPRPQRITREEPPKALAAGTYRFPGTTA